MRRFSLQMKLVFLAGFPALAFAVAALHIGYESWKDYQFAISSENKHRVLLAISGLIKEAQRERGQSSAFVSGANNRKELDLQRTATATAQNALVSAMANTTIADEQLEQFRTTQKSMELARSATEQKQERSAVIALYSGVVNDLLQLQIPLANGIRDMEGVIRVSLMEGAKENAGKLRANTAGILAADRPIGAGETRNLVNLKAAVQVSLQAPAIRTSRETAEQVQKFLESANWQEVTQVHYNVLEAAPLGRFNQDPKAYFALITRSIDELGGVIEAEFKSILMGIRADQMKSYHMMAASLALLATTVILLFVLAALTIRSVTRGLTEVIDTLVSTASDLAEAEKAITETSKALSQSASVTTTSIQRTATSMEEITAMLERNSADTESVQAETRRVLSDSRQGIERMSQALAAMNEILKNSSEIALLAKSVGEISEKTTLINDVVFQTQLLSFNASIEAARAGTHGKGFAVVAEEVGTLASNSGDTAHQISAIVSRSTQTAEKISSESRHKAEKGHALVSATAEIFQSVLEKSEKVTSKAEQIAVSSREQKTAIHDVKTDVLEIEKATHLSSRLAQKSKEASENLAKQSQDLMNVVQRLRGLIRNS